MALEIEVFWAPEWQRAKLVSFVPKKGPGVLVSLLLLLTLLLFMFLLLGVTLLAFAVYPVVAHVPAAFGILVYTGILLICCWRTSSG